MARKRREKLNYGLKTLVIINAFFPPAINVVLLTVFITQERLAGYLPTVSETGLESPNKFVMFLCFSVVGNVVFSFFMYYIFYLYKFYSISDKLKSDLYTLLFLAYVYFILIPIFPCDEIPIFHYLSTYLAFFNITIIQLIGHKITWKDTPTLKRRLRFFFIICQFLSLNLAAFSEQIFAVRYNVTLSTIGEYFISIFYAFYCLTFYNDLKKIKSFIYFGNNKEFQHIDIHNFEMPKLETEIKILK